MCAFCLLGVSPFVALSWGPHGSVLEWLRFISFDNDFSDNSRFIFFLLMTLKLFKISESPSDCVFLQSDVGCVPDWYSVNVIKLNHLSLLIMILVTTTHVFFFLLMTSKLFKISESPSGCVFLQLDVGCVPYWYSVNVMKLNRSKDAVTCTRWFWGMISWRSDYSNSNF